MNATQQAQPPGDKDRDLKKEEATNATQQAQPPDDKDRERLVSLIYSTNMH